MNLRNNENIIALPQEDKERIFTIPIMGYYHLNTDGSLEKNYEYADVPVRILADKFAAMLGTEIEDNS